MASADFVGGIIGQQRTLVGRSIGTAAFVEKAVMVRGDTVGMDLEMTIYSLPKAGPSQGDLVEGIKPRLDRMEEALDRINHLIRLTALSADRDDEALGSMGLDKFIEQEWYFLDANLYFKHNVQKQLDLPENLPATDSLGEDLPPSLKWLLQALAEEMEKEKIGKLALKARVVEGGINLVFRIEGGRLPDSFTRTLDRPVSESGTLKIEDPDVALTLAIALLKSSGASVTIQEMQTATEIILDLPVPPGGAARG